MLKNKNIYPIYNLTLMLIIPLGLIFGPLIPEISLFLMIIYLFSKKYEIAKVFNIYKKSFLFFFVFYILIIISSMFSIDPHESLIFTFSCLNIIYLFHISKSKKYRFFLYFINNNFYNFIL